jgi:hypothetical protein
VTTSPTITEPAIAFHAVVVAEPERRQPSTRSPASDGRRGRRWFQKPR